MAPGQTRGCLLSFQRLLNLLSSKEHLNVHQILKYKRKMNTYQVGRVLSRVFQWHVPLYHSVWPVWQLCCSNRSAVGAPPSCGPCVSSSINWPRMAGRCCAPSGVRCDVYRVWHFHLLLGWTLQPTVHTDTNTSGINTAYGLLCWRRSSLRQSATWCCWTNCTRGVLLDLGQAKPFLYPPGGTFTRSPHQKVRTHSANEGPDNGSVADGLGTFLTIIFPLFC